MQHILHNPQLNLSYLRQSNKQSSSLRLQFHPFFQLQMLIRLLLLLVVVSNLVPILRMLSRLIRRNNQQLKSNLKVLLSSRAVHRWLRVQVRYLNLANQQHRHKEHQLKNLPQNLSCLNQVLVQITITQLARNNSKLSQSRQSNNRIIAKFRAN